MSGRKSDNGIGHIKAGQIDDRSASMDWKEVGLVCVILVFYAISYYQFYYYTPYLYDDLRAYYLEGVAFLKSYVENGYFVFWNPYLYCGQPLNMNTMVATFTNPFIYLGQLYSLFVDNIDNHDVMYIFSFGQYLKAVLGGIGCLLLTRYFIDNWVARLFVAISYLGGAIWSDSYILSLNHFLPWGFYLGLNIFYKRCRYSLLLFPLLIFAGINSLAIAPGFFALALPFIFIIVALLTGRYKLTNEFFRSFKLSDYAIITAIGAGIVAFSLSVLQYLQSNLVVTTRKTLNYTEKYINHPVIVFDDLIKYMFSGVYYPSGYILTFCGVLTLGLLIISISVNKSRAYLPLVLTTLFFIASFCWDDMVHFRNAYLSFLNVIHLRWGLPVIELTALIIAGMTIDALLKENNRFHVYRSILAIFLSLLGCAAMYYFFHIRNGMWNGYLTLSLIAIIILSASMWLSASYRKYLLYGLLVIHAFSITYHYTNNFGFVDEQKRRLVNNPRHGDLDVFDTVMKAYNWRTENIFSKNRINESGPLNLGDDYNYDGLYDNFNHYITDSQAKSIDGRPVFDIPRRSYVSKKFYKLDRSVSRKNMKMLTGVTRPIIQFYDSAIWMNNDDILAMMASDKYKVNNLYLSLDENQSKPSNTSAAPIKGNESAYNKNSDFHILYSDYDRLIARLEANNKGYAFVSLNYYDHVVMWVNGEKVKPIRANYTFMAVEVPKGISKLEIQYTPLRLMILGYILYMVSIITIILFLHYIFTQFKISSTNKNYEIWSR